MTADFELELSFSGTNSEITDMLKIIDAYSRAGSRDAYFSSVKVNGNEMDLSAITLEQVTELTLDGSIVVTALGPYGQYSELNDVDLFRELAEASPKSSFKAEITGSQQYSVQSLKCELINGLLNIETYYESNDEVSSTWCDDFIDNLPLNEFEELFKINNGYLDDDIYKEILETIETDNYYSLDDMDYEDFLFNLNSHGISTELDEDEFTEIIEEKLIMFGIFSPQEFADYNNGGEAKSFVYDPIAKEYIEKEDSLFDAPSGKILDVDDIIAAGLRFQGLPDDPDSIANLSPEEANKAIMAFMEMDGDDDEKEYGEYPEDDE